MKIGVSRIIYIVLCITVLGVLSSETCGQVDGDANWQEGFVLPPGVDGEVLAIATIGNDVYVGGRFAKAGDLAAGSIARWDGTNWHSLAEGMAGDGIHRVEVTALVVSGTNLYVGGQFTLAGSVAATNLACWNGTEWRPVGDVAGHDSYLFDQPRVMALLFTNNQLFVAGNFREVSGVAATNIAMWNGTNWFAVGSGVGAKGGVIHALAHYRSQLYAGGRFFEADGVEAFNIARWDGRKWLPLGKGVRGGAAVYRIDGNDYSGEVNGLVVHKQTLWIGGSFTTAGRHRASNLARWTGRRWLRVGRGVGPENRSAVGRMLARENELWITGSFEHVKGVAATNVAIWQRKRWHPVGNGVNGNAFTLAFAENGRLFVGGDFGVAGGASAANVASWNGSGWSALGQGSGNTIMGYPSTIAASASRVYVAGQMHTAGTNAVKNVACWDGTNWSGLGNGIPIGIVEASAASGSNYYVAGSFEIPEIGATNVARWNGLEWKALGSGFRYFESPGRVSAIAVNGDSVYVAGYFTSAGGVPATNVAVWNGTNWSNAGTLRYGSYEPVVHGLAAWNGRVFISGIFGSVGFEDIVLEWDQTIWRSVWSESFASGHLPFVNSIALAGNDLFALGYFTNAPGIVATNFAKWDGEHWSDMGQPFASDTSLHSVAASSGYVYVGGYFSNLAGLPARSVARYNGVNWSSLGTGVQDTTGPGVVLSLAAQGTRLFVTGLFKTAGGKPSYRFAVWNERD